MKASKSNLSFAGAVWSKDSAVVRAVVKWQEGEISYSAAEIMCVARSGDGEEWRFDVSEMMARRINGNGNGPSGFSLVRSR